MLTGTLPAPAVPDSFSQRFPLHSNDNHPTGSGSSSSEEKDKEKEALVMRDMRYAAPRASVGGQWATFTGFEHRKDEEACIDFVFGRSDRVGWCVSLLFVFLLLHAFDEWGVLLDRPQGGERRLCRDGAFGRWDARERSPPRRRRCRHFLSGAKHGATRGTYSTILFRVRRTTAGRCRAVG